MARSKKKKKKAQRKDTVLADRLGEVLIEAAEHFNSNGAALEVSFPANCIRTIASLRSRWPYLSSARARTIACAIQLCDVNQFFQNCVTVSLTAGAMWEWQNSIPVIAIIETLCREVVLKERLDNDQVSFKKCINILQSKGFITPKLRDELQELRECRNNVHLYLNHKVSMADEKPRSYNRAVLALSKLEKTLKKHYRHWS